MKKVFTILAIALLASTSTFAQKYFTRTGKVTFFSDTKMEDIKADNNKTNVVLDATTGAVEISLLIKSFEFEKALMQEHFNENYMESDTYPKASFKGKVDNMSAVNLKKDGTYNATATGDMTMHGVTKKITINVTFKVVGGKITGETKFYIVPEDYNIKIPNTVRDNIASKIEVTATAVLEELKKEPTSDHVVQSY
ncbi:MAG: YceI family protein, partial [Flavobacteriales bacterium]